MKAANNFYCFDFDILNILVNFCHITDYFQVISWIDNWLFSSDILNWFLSTSTSLRRHFLCKTSQITSDLFSHSYYYFINFIYLFFCEFELLYFTLQFENGCFKNIFLLESINKCNNFDNLKNHWYQSGHNKIKCFFFLFLFFFLMSSDNKHNKFLRQPNKLYESVLRKCV